MKICQRQIDEFFQREMDETIFYRKMDENVSGKGRLVAFFKRPSINTSQNAIFHFWFIFDMITC